MYVTEGDPTSCWLWTGPRYRNGYGRFTHNGKARLAHRAAYELFVGPIPDGLQIDHVCHNVDTGCIEPTGCTHRRCVNPSHLEAVSGSTNLARAYSVPARRQNASVSTCRRGHEYTPENTYLNQSGHRVCRTCMQSHQRRWRAERKSEVSRCGEPMNSGRSCGREVGHDGRHYPPR